MGPGRYVPDRTEGITRVEDLPQPLVEHRSRSFRRRCCPRCGRSCYRDTLGRRVLHDGSRVKVEVRSKDKQGNGWRSSKTVRLR